MLDAHVHLDFMANGEEVASLGAQQGMSFYACTVTPAGYVAACERFGGFENVTVGLGLHPWWVGSPDEHPAGNADAAQAGNAFQANRREAEEALEAFVSLMKDARLIGEVGLDFGKRHAGTRDLQIGAFERIARECVRQGDKVLSIHSVHAAREAIDILQDTGAFESCTCIFHWFTGPSDQLKRAIDAGAFFSVGVRMLNTRKGREYVKAIPRDRVLCETDAPAERGQAVSVLDLREELSRAASEITALQRERR